MCKEARPAVASWIVESADAGTRLDTWLAVRLAVGRARVQTTISDGHVRVAGRRVRKSYVLAGGDEVTLVSDTPDATASEFSPVPEPTAPLDVRHQTDDMLVVNKPPGQPTHPLQQLETGTLANALVGHHPELRGIGYRSQEPGLLHRLDNGTSGLLVVARRQTVFEALRQSLHAGDWLKHYQALVSGRPALGEVHGFIGKEKGHRSRAQVFEEEQPGASRAVSLRILSSEPVGAEFSLIEVSVSRAARHQIRAQLAAIGHPIVGDKLYRGHDGEGLGSVSLSHHVLHASRIGVPAIAPRAAIDVSCELPSTVTAVLDALRLG